MIEIEVRNFQSIESASIQIDGFTALVGRSNIGKSAFVRAVRAALTGAPIAASIRHAPSCPRRLKKAKSCLCFSSVQIKAEGFDLLWEKGDAVNRYVFNGAVYDKVSQGTPEFLQDRFALVKVGESKELLQVADQFSPIFLLDQTGTVVADVLGDLAHLDRINVAIRSAEHDRRDAVSTRKVREKDVTELESKLASYAGLDEATVQVTGIKEGFTKVEWSQGAITQLGCYQKALAAIESEANGLAGACKPELPDSGLLLDRLSIAEKLRRLYVQLAERATAIRALLGVEAIDIVSPESAQEGARKFERVHSWTASMFEFQRWFDHRKVVDGSQMPSEEFFSETQKLIKLVGLAERWSSVRKSATSLESEAQRAEQAETEILQEFDAIGVCPTCTQAVHPLPH